MDTVTDTCLTNSLRCGSHSSLVSDNTRKLSILHTGLERNADGLQSFLSLIVFIFVDGPSDDVMQHSRKNVSLQEKVWYIGFSPINFFGW